MKTREKGITLIALIITIVIVLILVGIGVKVAINSSLIDTTANTVNEHSNKVETEQSRVDELMGELDSVLEAKCFHTIVDGTCTKCGHSLVLGAYINGYNPTIAADGSTISTSYESDAEATGYSTDQTFTVSSVTEWQVLGEEDGHIIITTANPIQTDEKTGYYMGSTEGYENSIEALNKISGIYGQGKYADTGKYSYALETRTIASGGRSINIHDIGCTVNDTPTTYVFKKNATTGYIDTDKAEGSTYKKFIYWGENAYPSEGPGWKELGSGESVTIADYKYKTGTKTSEQGKMIFGDQTNRL